MFRTDLAVNYNFRLPGTARSELFAQFQLLNVVQQLPVVQHPIERDQHHRADRG